MALVQSGEFEIGRKEGGWQWQYGPQKVTINYDFYFSKKPVTYSHWAECVKAGNCQPIDDPANCKSCAVKVSWNDTQDYLGWLKKKTGLNMRLPSETEWAYAIRGNMPIPDEWFFSIDLPPIAQPNYVNSWGISPCLGQHGEWVQDCFKANYYGLPLDGSPREDGNCFKRLIRNHGVIKDFNTLLIGRKPFFRDMRGSNITFRVVYTVANQID